MRLPLPILQPLGFVKDAFEQLDCKINSCQKKNLILIVTAMFLAGSMCLSTITLALVNVISTSALSHCFSYSGLSGEQLMLCAVKWGIRTMNILGISARIAVDDTMKHHSKGCRCIDSVYWLFDHVLGSFCNAKCIVFIYLVVNERIRFPIGWRVYRQGGKSKWRLAVELIDEALYHGINISVVLFDSWFCVNGFIKQLEKRNLKFIGDLKSGHNVEYGVENKTWMKIRFSIKELFKCGTPLLKEVWLGLKSNTGERPDKALYKTWSTVAYIGAFKGKYKIIKSIDQRTGGCKIFITNELTWEAQKVLEEFSFRWMIEEFFGNAKGFNGFEEACIRSEQGGAITLFLVSFVDLLISIKLWKGVHENSKEKLSTVSAIYATAAEENLQNLLMVSEDSDKIREVITVWLEILEKKKRQVRRERKALVEVTQTKECDDSLITPQEVAA